MLLPTDSMPGTPQPYVLWIDGRMTVPCSKLPQKTTLLKPLLWSGRGINSIFAGLPPEIEVDLCGHATLASAYVLFRYHLPEQEKLWISTPREVEN